MKEKNCRRMKRSSPPPSSLGGCVVVIPDKYIILSRFIYNDLLSLHFTVKYFFFILKRKKF